MTTVVRGADGLWRWSRDHWDPARGLVANPVGGYVELGPFAGTHLIRETAWFALDALAHGEVPVAVEALRTVLDRQYDRPGRPWHGTFPIFEHDPEPGDDAIMWWSYDPNWRQFVGVALALAVSRYGEVLPAPLVRACEQAVRRCVEGEPPGRIAPAYTNPALMHAWLADWAGQRFGEPAVAAEGLALAAEVMALFDATATVGEFNSPTYDGVNLVAAALWAGAAPPLRGWGHRLLDSMFDSLAFLYHPGLHNLAGPYTRAYGMDLGSRITLYGLWRLVVGGDPSALPSLAGDVDHSHDLFFAPVVELAARFLPRPFPADDGRFPRRRTFSLPGGRTARAFLGPDVMMGAEEGGREGMVWDQYVPGSVHWREPGGEDGVSWLRVHAAADAPVDCVLSGGPGLSVVSVGGGPVRLSTNSVVDGGGNGPLGLGRRVVLAAPGRIDVEELADGRRLVVAAAGPVTVTVTPGAAGA